MNSDDKDRMHGEGDRESARKYNEAAHRFVKAGQAKHPINRQTFPKRISIGPSILEKSAPKKKTSVSRDYKKPNR